MIDDPIRLQIVIDASHIREPLQKYLTETYGYSVTCAEDGNAALAAAAEKEGDCDVLLVDQLLSGPLSGIDIMQKAKACCPHIETIILAGSTAEHRKAALESGAFLVIDKGQFDPAELAMMVRNAAQQVRLRQISRRILGERNMTSLLEMIAASARSLALADTAAIVVKEADGWQVIPDLSDTPTKWRHPFRDETLTERIVSAVQPILVSDTTKDDRVAAAVIESGIRTLLGVPIPAIQDGLGALYVYSEHIGRFDGWGTVGLLQSLADQAGIAIANARAFAEREQAAAEFEAIHRFGAELNHSLRIDEILKRVASSGRQLIRAERCTALFYDERNMRFQQEGVSSNAEKYPPIIVDPRPNGYTKHKIFDEGVPFIVRDLRQDPKRNQEVFDCGVLSTLGVPMKVRGEVIGALYAHSSKSNYFAQHHVHLLESLANTASHVLHNAQIYRESRSQTKLLTALEEALSNVRSEKETAKLEQEIVRLAVEFLECDFGGLCRNRAALNEVELIVSHNFAPSGELGVFSYSGGLIGETVVKAKSQIANAYAEGDFVDPILAEVVVQALMTMPLWNGPELEAVLFVGRCSPAAGFTTPEQEILAMYAEQAATNWRTSQLLNADQRRFGQLEILHYISDYIQADEELSRVLHMTLTGIAAGYGLGFNRAALFLLDDDRTTLRGRMGIGELSQGKAHDEWLKGHQTDTVRFHRYIEDLKQGSLAPTTLEGILPTLHFSTAALAGTLFGDVLDRQHWIKCDDELGPLPQSFIDAFEPASPLVIVSLRARNQVTGLLVVDNKFTRAPITKEAIESLKTFANTAAIAIDNTLLLERAQAAEAQLRALFTASNSLVSSLEPQKILENVVDQALQVTGAMSVSIVRIDKGGNVHELVSQGEGESLRTEQVVRRAGAGGISMQVLRTGKAEKYENASNEAHRINPSTLERKIQAGLCLPFQVSGVPIGVMWLHYSRPRTFSAEQIETYQLHANQAAVAYDGARRLTQLTKLREATERLATIRGERDALRRIAESARGVLRADFAAVLPYDPERSQFQASNSVAVGIKPHLWQQRLLKENASSGPIAHRIIEKAWVSSNSLNLGAEDTHDDDAFLAGEISRLLSLMDTACYQAVALSVGDLPLGVLFVSYSKKRYFDDDARSMATAFANYAALAWQNARLIDQMKRTQDAARAVAQKSTQELLDDTLHTIVTSVRLAVACDAVTLYPYDEQEEKLGYPPSMTGVRYGERVHMGGRVPADSIVEHVLQRDKLYIAPDVAVDPLISKGNFAVREGIKSAVGIPLRAQQRSVGVMFVSYRTSHHFSEDELSNIHHFAHQAAVAIHTAQLYEYMRRIKGFVGSHTATEWIRMVSLGWGHTLRRQVGNVRNQIELLRMDVEEYASSEEVLERLDDLERVVASIGEIPILAPLSSDEAVDSIRINELLRDYLQRAYGETGRYQDIDLSLNLQPELDETTTVRASNAWLQRAFEVVLDNAADAMRATASSIRQMRVSTQRDEARVVIAFTDTGPGIPTAVRNHIFGKVIEKPIGSRGAGIGLLHAQAIVQTYGGDIELSRSDPTGTTMTIWLPIEVNPTGPQEN